MRKYLTWKLLILLVFVLIIGSGSYIIANTVLKPKPKPPTESIGFDKLNNEATKSADKPDNKSDESKSDGSNDNEDVKGSTSQENLPSYEITQPNNSNNEQGVDQAKLDAIYAALNKAADQKASAYIYNDSLKKFQQYQLDCYDNIYSNPDNDILSPSQKQALVKSCEDGYQPTIDSYQKKIDEANRLYNQYYQQALQIYSQCPSCSQYIKF